MTNGHREISASEVLEWSRTDTPMVRVETARDELPGGLAMAMAPLMVHWNASSLGFGANDYYLVHNVNVFSNPIEGTTTLATVRVPAAGVESIEFVMVLSKVAKTQTEFGHAQLRFIFEAKKRPVILSIEGKPIPHRAEMKDLVLSWEAWRSPGASFDPVAGLDPQRYALSLRCFNGSVRYMSDSLFERPWTCYPIQLPDLPNAANEFLYVGLLLGDAVARQTIFGLLDRQIEAGRNMPEDYSEPEASEWAEVKDAIKRENLPDDSIRDMLSGKLRYHLLLHSCVTMALMTLDWANVRLHQRTGLPLPKRIRVTPDSQPDFIDDLAHGKRSSALLRLPAALHWLMHHQTVIPGRAYLLLDEAGLLQRRNGRIVRKTYANREETPYGFLKDHLIF